MITLTEKRIRELENKYTLLLADIESKKTNGQDLQEIRSEASILKGQIVAVEELLKGLKDELSRQDVISSRSHAEQQASCKWLETSAKNTEATLAYLSDTIKHHEKGLSDVKPTLTRLGAEQEACKLSISDSSEKIKALQENVLRLVGELVKSQDRINEVLLVIKDVKETEKNRWIDEKHTDEELREANKTLRDKLEEAKTAHNLEISKLNDKCSLFKDFDSRLTTIATIIENKNQDASITSSLKSFYDKVEKHDEKLKSIESALADVLGLIKTLKKN